MIQSSFKNTVLLTVLCNQSPDRDQLESRMFYVSISGVIKNKEDKSCLRGFEEQLMDEFMNISKDIDNKIILPDVFCKFGNDECVELVDGQVIKTSWVLQSGDNFMSSSVDIVEYYKKQFDNFFSSAKLNAGIIPDYDLSISVLNEENEDEEASIKYCYGGI